MNRDPTAEDDAENSDASDAITRRGALAVGGAVGLASLAGCTALDVVTGDEPAEFTAGSATVADATLSETGYELNDVSEETISREVEAAGQTQEVQVTNTVAEYDKAVELFGERYQAAVFAAVTTPQIEVLGEALNPIDDFSTRERAELILSRFEGVGDLERGSEYSTSVLGSDAAVVVYTADAEIEGTGVTTELELHIGEPVGVEDDFVLPLAAYPVAFSDGENVRLMMNGIEHEPDGEN
ncbi:hypothetical protein EXE46_02275 [Halorubrum sp. GN11_10-6_MGM]|uniref:DUF6517 family protein n=1 Tax=Halorubrum sp. GN11_10-6_MGM TaxID=2518112 RepID=UPI0010F667A5|nr:DUF6517 family protein [Halorubrum sp. GN11_10-6_MGM]TKX75595.1 hypothetical protein EXE46_02275 [Halorubrum sp. GN11_10-6_MGM]